VGWMWVVCVLGLLSAIWRLSISPAPGVRYDGAMGMSSDWVGGLGMADAKCGG